MTPQASDAKSLANMPRPQKPERKMMGEALSKYLDGKFEDAKGRCITILVDYPQMPEPFFLLGEIHEQMKQPKMALQLYRMSADLQVRSKDYHIWMKIGSLAEKEGDLRVAFEAFSNASTRLLYTKSMEDENGEVVEEEDLPKDEKDFRTLDEAGKLSMWKTSKRNIYFSCDFESFERKALIAMKVGDHEEAIKAMRRILNGQKNPNPKWFISMIDAYHALHTTASKLQRALEVFVEPLVTVDTQEIDKRKAGDDMQSVSSLKPSELDNKNFALHIYLFEVFLRCLLEQQKSEEVLVYLNRFDSFLASSPVDPSVYRFDYIHRARFNGSPVQFAGIKAAALIIQGQTTNANALLHHINTPATRRLAGTVKAKLYAGEACLVKFEYQLALEILRGLDAGYGEWIVAESYFNLEEKEKSIEFFKMVLARMEGGETIETAIRGTELKISAVAGKLFEVYWELDMKEEHQALWSNPVYELAKDSYKKVKEVTKKKKKNPVTPSKSNPKSSTAETLPEWLRLSHQPEFNEATETASTEEGVMLPSPTTKYDNSMDLVLPSLPSEEEKKVVIRKGRRSNIFTNFNMADDAPVSKRRRKNEFSGPSGPVRPATLQKIARCEQLFEANEYKKCIQIGMDLLYPYFGNTEKAVPSYTTICRYFECQVDEEETSLQEEELVSTFRFIFHSLIKLGKATEAVFLTKDLYQSSDVAFVKISPKTNAYHQVFGFLLLACFEANDLGELARQMVGLMNDVLGSQVKIRYADACQSILSTLQFCMNHTGDKKNLVRIVRRLTRSFIDNADQFDAANPDAPKNPRAILSLLLLVANYESDFDNPVRAFSMLQKAISVCPTNSFVHLMMSACYLRLRLSRKAPDPNHLALKGLAHLDRYASLRPAEFAYETEYNLAVFFHHCGDIRLAADNYTNVLNRPDTPDALKVQCASALVNFHREDNPELAEGLVNRYLTY